MVYGQKMYDKESTIYNGVKLISSKNGVGKKTEVYKHIERIQITVLILAAMTYSGYCII